MKSNGKNRDALSLKDKLILTGVACVFFPFFIAALIIYFQLSDALLELSKEKSLHMAKDISASIDNILIQEIKLAQSIAADPDIVEASKSGDYATAQLELESIYERIGKSYFTIFLTDEHGTTRADAFFKEKIGLNLSDRDYFIKSKKGISTVAGPMISRATPNDIIIVVCTPIYKNDKFYGIVGVPFRIDFLVKIISQQNKGKAGYSFLFDNSGLIIAHPNIDYILKLNLFDMPGTEKIKKSIEVNQSDVIPYSFNGVDTIAGLSKFRHVAWIAAYAQDQEEIIAPVNKIIKSIFITGSIVLLVTILGILLFTRRISTPIQKMMEMMKQITKYSTEAILQIGLDKKIIYANPAYEKIAGLKAGDITGSEPCLKNTGDLDQQVIWESIESGNSWSGRVLLEGQNSRLITLEIMLVPLRDEKGAIHGYLQIGRDVTTELMFKKRLQQSQKLEAIGTLAGGIAHDFNNILSAIFGYAELCLMEETSMPEVKKYIEQIRAVSERARDLVKQILTFSRKTEVDRRPLKPKFILKEALKLLRASIPATIDIQSELGCDSVIMGEPTQLHQIVMNLFLNAAHAIGDRAGQIVLKLEDFWADSEFCSAHPGIRNGKYVKMSVSDTGNGIDPRISEKYLNRFLRPSPKV